MNRTNKKNRGFTLLITLLLMTVLLGVSGALLNVVLRQYKLSGIAQISEMAFQAANAGMECVLYHDFLYYNSGTSIFDVGEDQVTGLTCFSGSDAAAVTGRNIASGEEQSFEFTWGDPLVCTKISVYKFFDSSTIVSMASVVGKTRDCPAGSVCTVIKSRGYNTDCNLIKNNPRVVERELIQIY